MITNKNKILIEWAYRTRNGKPNPKSMAHQIILEDILKEYGCGREEIDELFKGKRFQLFEAPENKPLSDADKEKIKKMGLIWKGKGYGKENEEGIIFKNVDGKLVSVDKKGDGKEDDAGKLDKKSDFERDAEPNKGASADYQRDDGEDDSEKAEDNPQSEREETINKVLDLFVPPAEEQQGGAGRFSLTENDVNDYKEWLKLKPEEREAKQKEIVERQREKIGEVTEEDIDQFLVDLKEKLGKKAFDSLMTSIKKKGDPPGEYNTGKYPDDHPTYPGQYKATVRARNVIKHYLQTGGVNPMNGQVVPFSESQLDHIVSLDNGGEDGPENWMWMEARINQFKGSLTDTEVESKLIERGLKTADEISRDASESEMKNWQTQAEIAYWETRFENNDIANLSVDSINNMNNEELTNLIKAWNRYVGEGDPRYIGRYGSSKVEIGGKKHTVSRDGVVKPDKDDPKTWGVTKQPDGSLKQTKMTYKQAQAAYNKARKSGGRGAGGDVLRDGILNALTGEQSPFKDDKGDTATIPTKGDEDAVDVEFEAIQGEKAEKKRDLDNIKKAIKDNPRSADNLKKQITREPKHKELKAGIKAAIGKGSKKKPDNPEEYKRLKQEYDEWYLSKWKGGLSLIG